MEKREKIINQTDESILLHVCCAPCAGGCIERLLANCGRVGFFYSNSNMATENEFLHRLEYVKNLAKMFNIPLFTDKYQHNDWLEKCAPFSSSPEGGERCRRCFEFSLNRTAAAAARLGFDTFATSLTVSPKKSSSVIFEIGEQFPAFRKWNFKKESGYLRGMTIAKENGFYRQNFCACEFSITNPLTP